MEKIRFVNTRFAVFFNEPIARPEILIADFEKEMGDIFNQSPLTVPIPNTPALGSTPVVQFISSDSKHQATFSRQRADYYHFSSDRKKQYEWKEIEETFIKNVEKYLKFFSTKAKIGRVAFITQSFIKTDNPGKIISNLINQNLVDLQGGEIRNSMIQYISRSKSKNGEFEVNNNTKIEKTDIVLYGELNDAQQNGILITRDFNTIPERSKEYEGKFIFERVKEIIEEGKENFKLEEIEKLLWPTAEKTQ